MMSKLVFLSIVSLPPNKKMVKRYWVRGSDFAIVRPGVPLSCEYRTVLSWTLYYDDRAFKQGPE